MFSTKIVYCLKLFRWLILLFILTIGFCWHGTLHQNIQCKKTNVLHQLKRFSTCLLHFPEKCLNTFVWNLHVTNNQISFLLLKPVSCFWCFTIWCCEKLMLMKHFLINLRLEHTEMKCWCKQPAMSMPLFSIWCQQAISYPRPHEFIDKSILGRCNVQWIT